MSPSPGHSTIRPRLLAAVAVLGWLPVCLATTSAAPARSNVSAPTHAPARPALLTSAERAMAAWRIARGIDRAQDRVGPLDPERAAIDLGSSSQPIPNPDDVHWRAGFGLPVPDGSITALLPHDGLLVAGGYFRMIGGLEAPGIAAWDGTAWSRFGDLPQGHAVLDLTPYPGGILALSTWPAVWRWDGFVWSQLAPFPWWAVYASDMAALDAQVAVSVWAYEASRPLGREWVARVLLYDGTDWTPLGGHFNRGVQALAWYGGELYAAGDFDSLDTTPLPIIARWDGSAWQPLGEGLPPPRWQVRALTVFDGELVAGGSFGDDPSLPRGFARWNGSRWASLGHSPPEYPNLTRLTVVGSDLQALGRFTSDHIYGIARWDGVEWHAGEDSLQAFVYDVASYQGDLYAGGALASDGSRAAPALARRRSGHWEAPVTPGPGMQGLLGWDGPSASALLSTAEGIIAGGRFVFAGKDGGWTHCPAAALWDGARWSAIGSESWREFVPRDFALHDGSTMAVGYFEAPTIGYATVARLQGNEWQLVGTPMWNLYCAASALGHLFVGGAVQPDPMKGIARWDGTTWQGVGGGVTRGDYVTAVTPHLGEVIAGGSFEEVDGVPCSNVAAWSPSRGWRPLGEGLNGPVSDLTSRNGVLYASGSFGVARWNGDRWESIPGLRDVWVLGWFHGRLVAGGYGVLGRLAILEDDDGWHALGSGINGAALSFAERGPSLFVGGYFSRAGGKPAYGFAQWRDETGYVPVGPRITAAPNPVVAQVRLSYELASSGPTRVEIFDLAGHLVDRPFDGFQDAGPQLVTWTPDRRRVRTGVYFARVAGVGTKQVVRVVVAR